MRLKLKFEEIEESLRRITSTGVSSDPKRSKSSCLQGKGIDYVFGTTCGEQTTCAPSWQCTQHDVISIEDGLPSGPETMFLGYGREAGVGGTDKFPEIGLWQLAVVCQGCCHGGYE